MTKSLVFSEMGDDSRLSTDARLMISITITEMEYAEMQFLSFGWLVACSIRIFAIWTQKKDSCTTWMDLKEYSDVIHPGKGGWRIQGNRHFQGA